MHLLQSPRRVRTGLISHRFSIVKELQLLPAVSCFAGVWSLVHLERFGLLGEGLGSYPKPQTADANHHSPMP